MNNEKLVEVSIDKLRLRTIIGYNDWEREEKQDVIISLCFKYDAGKAIETDEVEHACNYKSIIKDVIKEVESSRFKLLETLTAKIHKIVMSNKGVISAEVKVDKPFALRFSDSVSVKMTNRNGS